MDQDPERPQEAPKLPSNGKDEMNLAEFPIALLTDRVPRGVKTIESQDEFFDERTNQVITRKRIITGSDKYGLPTAKDDEVILGLIQLTREANDFTERTVKFSRRKLIGRLGWAETGQSFRRLERSLDCWVNVGLNYEKAWYDNIHKSWVDEKFHIIDRVSLYDAEEQATQPFEKLSSFTWNEVIFRSFQAGYLKSLDLDFYFGLKSATAKRLYRFLDKRFYLKPRWTFGLRDFAFNHIGLSRSSYEGNGHLAKKLRPAIEELEALGFLEPLPEQTRFERRSRSDWRVLFVRGKDVPGGLPLFESKALPGPQARPGRKPKSRTEPVSLGQELVSRGVTAGVASALVAEYPEEQIRRQLEHADFLAEAGGKEISNPGAYLAKAVRDDFAPPPGFEPKVVRDKRREAERIRERQRQEEARERKASERREQETQRRMDELWATLTEGEKQQLEKQALADADEETRAQYHAAQRGPHQRLLVVGIRKAYLRKLVEADLAGNAGLAE